MATNFFELNRTKKFLNIEVTDTADDELLMFYGETANQHIDNILSQHDERIPLKVPSVLADIKTAASYYVCSLFRGKRGDIEVADFWMKMFTDAINGVIESETIEAYSYEVARFGDRFDTDDVYKLWW